MLIAQLAAIVTVGFLLLLIHRSGIPRTLRTIGAFFWSAADAVEHWRERFSLAMVNARELEKR